MLSSSASHSSSFCFGRAGAFFTCSSRNGYSRTSKVPSLSATFTRVRSVMTLFSSTVPVPSGVMTSRPVRGICLRMLS